MISPNMVVDCLTWREVVGPGTGIKNKINDKEHFNGFHILLS